MKKVRIENFALVAYVEESDIRALKKLEYCGRTQDEKGKIVSTVRPEVPDEVYQEIEEGLEVQPIEDTKYLKFKNIHAVNYIKGAHFIPNEDFLDKEVTREDLEAMLEKSKTDYEYILETLRKLYAKEQISEEEIITLSQCDALSVRLTRDAVKAAYANNDFASELQYIICEEAIIVQAEHYMDSLNAYWRKKGHLKPAQRPMAKVLSRFCKAFGGK